MSNKLSKIFVVYGIFFSVAGIIGLAIKNDLIEYLNISPISVLTMSITLLLTGFAFFLLLYVRGDFSSSQKNTIFSETSGDLDKLEKRINTIDTELYAKFSAFKNADDITKDIQESIDKKVSEISQDKIFQLISDKYKEETINETKFKTIDSELLDVKKRIERETARISRYGYINLMIGFVTTFLAIFFLGYSLLGVQTTNISATDYIYHFIPRLSLSILIEVFSFFFLRLYKKNLDDIKFFNNERTNIEMKVISVKTGLLFNDKEVISQLVKDLSKTERNFVLKKGESTVELEKNKMETNSSDNLLKGILKILDRK